MDQYVKPDQDQPQPVAAAEPAVAVEPAVPEAAPEPAATPAPQQPKPEERPPRTDRPRADRGDRRPAGGHDRGGGGRPGPGPDRGPDRGHDRGGRDAGGRPGGRPFEPMMEIDIEKLISDSLYLDNQAHGVVARMRDMDSGTKSQLRRLFNAVRRAVAAQESDRQHQFVMLRARLAYTIARHSLRSLDGLERLLLQVTRKNEARGYQRFKDLFEAIVAYNE